MIPVAEIFGPTIQGEGSVIGKKTMFVRTYGCDYRCKWCDSAFTWDGTERPTLMKPEAIVERLFELGGDGFNHVTISGGNPALIGDSMESLIDILQSCGIRVGLETQGSRWKDWFYKIDDLVISPKPPSSGMDTDFDMLTMICERLMMVEGNYSLKVVVFDDRDFEYAKMVHRMFPKIPFYLSVGNDRVNAQDDITSALLARLKWLVEKVIADPEMNSVAVLPQLHTLIWGNERGV
jgi:7-carboxy-7-deazaguanine synthase